MATASSTPTIMPATCPRVSDDEAGAGTQADWLGTRPPGHEATQPPSKRKKGERQMLQVWRSRVQVRVKVRVR